MKNIHVLPTSKPSKIIKNNLGIAINENLNQKELDLIQAKFVNHYITNSEEIKEGDWFVVKLFKITGESDGLHIEKCTKLNDVWCNNFDVISTRHKDNCKKIILTDNKDLIADGVQAIDDEFLEWFVKNPSCEEVMVEKFHGINTSIAEVNAISGDGSLNWQGKDDLRDYKIIIPKEEPKPIYQQIIDAVGGGR